MKDFLLNIREKFAKPVEEEEAYDQQVDEYVELSSHTESEGKSNCIFVTGLNGFGNAGCNA